MADPGKTKVRLTAPLQRKHPNLPVFVVIPGRRVAAWQLTGTTTIECRANGHLTGRRTIKAWGKGSDDWFVEFTAPFCKAAGLAVGDEVKLELVIADDTAPDELEAVLASSKLLQEIWSKLTASQRREAMEHVRSAKTDVTRARRAAAIADALRLRWKSRHSQA